MFSSTSLGLLCFATLIVLFNRLDLPLFTTAMTIMFCPDNDLTLYSDNTIVNRALELSSHYTQSVVQAFVQHLFTMTIATIYCLNRSEVSYSDNTNSIVPY